MQTLSSSSNNSLYNKMLYKDIYNAYNVTVDARDACVLQKTKLKGSPEDKSIKSAHSFHFVRKERKLQYIFVTHFLLYMLYVYQRYAKQGFQVQTLLSPRLHTYTL